MALQIHKFQLVITFYKGTLHLFQIHLVSPKPGLYNSNNTLLSNISTSPLTAPKCIASCSHLLPRRRSRAGQSAEHSPWQLLVGAALTQALHTAAEPRQMLLPHLQQAPGHQCLQTATAQPRDGSPAPPFPVGLCSQGPDRLWRHRHLTCRLKTANTSTQTRFLGPGMASQTCLLDAHAGLGQQQSWALSPAKGLFRVCICEWRIKKQGSALVYTGMWGRLDPSLRTLTCLQYKAITDVYSNTSPGGQNTHMHNSPFYINSLPDLIS